MLDAGARLLSGLLGPYSTAYVRGREGGLDPRRVTRNVLRIGALGRVAPSGEKWWWIDPTGFEFVVGAARILGDGAQGAINPLDRMGNSRQEFHFYCVSAHESMVSIRTARCMRNGYIALTPVPSMTPRNSLTNGSESNVLLRAHGEPR